MPPARKLSRPVQWLVGTMVFASGACVIYVPPPPPAPTSLLFETSLDRTWNASVAAFAEMGLELTTNDKSSGLLMAHRDSLARMAPRTAERFADCGHMGGVWVPPTTVTYTVRVHGDSAHTTLETSTYWAYSRGPDPRSTLVCASNGLWESRFIAQVRTNLAASR